MAKRTQGIPRDVLLQTKEWALVKGFLQSDEVLLVWFGGAKSRPGTQNYRGTEISEEIPRSDLPRIGP